MIEVVVSDFGGVLTTPLEGSFDAYAREVGLPLEALGSAIRARADRDGVNPIHQLEVGAITERDFLDGLAADLTALGHPEVATEGFAAAYFRHLDVNDTMVAALRSWRSRGLRLALCTNNVAEWEPLWRAMLPIDELFEVVVDSAFVGVRKPDPAIYRLVLERLGVPAGHCAFVDDLAVNCDAASALGFHAVRFTGTAAAVSAVERLLAH